MSTLPVLKVTVPRSEIDAPEGGVPETEWAVFRLMLGRRMLTLAGLPRRCHEPLCRHSGRCVGPSMRCRRDYPMPPLTPEQTADAAFEMRSMLTQELARRGML